MTSRIPPPFVCEHPRNLWEGYGSWFYTEAGVTGSLTHYVCRGCGTTIPAAAVSDEEWVRRSVDRALLDFSPAFERLAKE